MENVSNLKPAVKRTFGSTMLSFRKFSCKQSLVFACIFPFSKAETVILTFVDLNRKDCFNSIKSA